MFSTWVFLCLFRLSFLEKYFLHTGHENSFFPVCDTMCLIRCSFRLNDLGHPSCSHLNGRNPTCDFKCCIKCSFRLNVFEHTSHAVKLTPPEPLALFAELLPVASCPPAASCLIESAEMAFICWVAAIDWAVREPAPIDSVELFSRSSWDSRRLLGGWVEGGAGGGFGLWGFGLTCCCCC